MKLNKTPYNSQCTEVVFWSLLLRLRWNHRNFWTHSCFPYMVVYIVVTLHSLPSLCMEGLLGCLGSPKHPSVPSHKLDLVHQALKRENIQFLSSCFKISNLGTCIVHDFPWQWPSQTVVYLPSPNDVDLLTESELSQLSQEDWRNACEWFCSPLSYWIKNRKMEAQKRDCMHTKTLQYVRVRRLYSYYCLIL